MNRFSGVILSAAVALLMRTPLAWADCESGSLNILLTNDDGYDQPGIQAEREALLKAGHHVTVVAPLTNQSGTGGGLNSTTGAFVSVTQQQPGVWSVASTPSDAVRAGLGAVLAGHPPDLIVSGANFGQNLGQPATSASGTIGAALTGLYNDIPAIAVSVGVDFAEAKAAPNPFPSTLAAFGPTANFTAHLIAALQGRCSAGKLLPGHTMLNVNVPVPYSTIKGVKLTRLASKGAVAFLWQDVNNVIPTGGGPVRLTISVTQGRDIVLNSDRNAYADRFISISPITGDMSQDHTTRLPAMADLLRLSP